MKKPRRFNVPFRAWVPLIYFAYYLSILLLLLLWPLRLLYGAVLCALGWFVWVRPTRDVLLVLDSSAKNDDYLIRLLPMLEGRAFTLDYGRRDHWPRFSFATQLFHLFGPKPIPERFIPLYLPAVIVVRRFRRPKKFTFGERSRREENLAALQSELQEKAGSL